MATFGDRVTQLEYRTLARRGALETVIYTSRGLPTTDLDTGAIAQSALTLSLDVLLTAYVREEVGGVTVVQGDQKATFPKALLPVEPTTRDTVDRHGVTWAVVGILETGNAGLWSLQLRRPGLP